MWFQLQTRLLWLPLLLSVACIVDSDDRCGEDQLLNEMGVCECKEGTVLSEGRDCTPQVSVPAGLGVECSEDLPCADSTYSFCASSDFGHPECL